MIRATQSCARSVSPMLHRHVTRVTPLASAPEMSSDATSKASKSSKKSSKSTKTASAPPKEAPAAASEPVEKGDSYKSGDEYFGFNPYSFYDIENSVQPLRCPQPSSEKASQ